MWASGSPGTAEDPVLAEKLLPHALPWCGMWRIFTLYADIPGGYGLMKARMVIMAFLFLSITAVAAHSAPVFPPTMEGAYAVFKNPPSAYRSMTFWVWNNRISEKEIDEQLRDFRDKGIGGVFIHPRPGLITPYLSDEWFSRFAYAVKAAKSLGMTAFIYDENSYPSGFAGGHVPAAMPDAAGTGLHITRVEKLPNPLPKETVLVLMRRGDGFEDITKSVADHTGTGEFRLFDIRWSGQSPWYGGFSYVDIMRRDVTEKFLSVTLDAYKRVIGDEFGKTVPGSFQDEAHISPVGGADVVNYTSALFDTFKAKHGYDLRPNLPSLFDETGDWKKVRHDYYATLLDLFIENWAKPYYEYCERNRLEFTGHYWEHEWPNPHIGPDNLAMAAFAHIPGVDILMNEYDTGTHSQFGNARAIKEIRSAANQFGRERTLSETYGAGGWDLTYLDQKRIGDWEYVLGVNLLNQHLSYVTLMGARKRDHPQSFSYHEPWWGQYKVLGDYFGRLSVAMSLGAQENRILVIEPTSSAWMYYSPDRKNPRLAQVGDEFQAFVNRLEAAQVEYDLGSEDTIARFGSVEKNTFKVGNAPYALVIVPPGTDNLDRSTVGLLGKFLSGGGRVLAWTMPDRVDGASSDAAKKLAQANPSSWTLVTESDPGPAVARISKPVVHFTVAGAEPGMLFHHRRTFRDGTLLFLVNTSLKTPARGTVSLRGGSVERWDPFTGKKLPHPFSRSGNDVSASFDLPPAGSLLLSIRPGAGKPYAEPPVTASVIEPSGPVTIARTAPNILTLDYCDLAYGDSTYQGLYYWEAARTAFRHHGLPGNPWESAVQYKSNILDKNSFPADSGCKVSYRFTAASGVPLASLRAVVERPELWKVSINGTPVDPTPGAWTLDRSFGVYDIGRAAREGGNIITLTSKPFTIHTEIEAVYVTGDFSLEPAAKGFTITPPKALSYGNWNAQGLPFYADGVKYTRTYDIPASASRGGKIMVTFDGWNGSLADVRVNGASAGIIAFPPYELDVTGYTRPGVNNIEVTVYGTLKNTLGPHHNNPPLGRAWPGMFQQGAKGGQPSGTAYSTVGYGLTGDFFVKAIHVTR